MADPTGGERLVASSDRDLVWRAQISGTLADLTKQVLALTEVVLTMNEKLAAAEAQSQESDPEWKKKTCGCVKTTLPMFGKIAIRCPKHRGKPAKGERTLCYFDDAGNVRPE